MSTKVYLVVFVLALLAVSTGWAAVPSPPAWPQSFSLGLGEKVEYAVPMTQDGDIVVNVQWRGNPPLITIKDPVGNTVASSATTQPQNSTSARVSCKVSADRTKAQAWSVSIALPGVLAVRNRAVSTGQVTIQSPAANRQQLAALDANAYSRLRTSIKALAPKALTTTPTIMSKPGKLVLTPAQVDREAVLRGRMATNLAAFSSKMSLMVASSTASGGAASATTKSTIVSNQSIGITPPANLGTVRTRATAAGDPVLIDVTPNQAMPGEHVFVSGKNIPKDKFQNAVWFVIGSTIKAEAKTINITQSGDVIKYEVQLMDAGASQNYDPGSVYMIPKDTGIPTNSMPFHFVATPVPTITSIEPAMAGPGDTVQINGANFKPDAVADFIIDAIGDNESPQVQYASPTRLIAKVPTYANQKPSVAQVYVVQKGITGYIKGPSLSLALKPTVPTISGLRDPSGQPGDPILVEGMGFKQPVEVHFIDQAGQDIPSDVAASDDCSVLTHVPDISGIAGPTPWKLYVKSGNGPSEKTDVTIQPAMETKTLEVNLKAVNVASNSYFQGDNFDWARLGIVNTVPFAVALDAMLQLDLNSGSSDSWTLDKDNNLLATHVGGFWDGHKNDDEFFGHRDKDNNSKFVPNFRLKNGWVVDSISFYKSCDPKEANADIWDSVLISTDIPKDCPYVSVHWWDSPIHDGVCYTLSWIIKGPKGVPYY